MSLARPFVLLPATLALLAAACTPVKPVPVVDVIYVPTPPAVVERMLQMADVRSDDIVYDLGSGDGRIVIAAAKERGARGTGVEIDPALIAESKKNAEAAGVADKVRFIQADLFTVDFHDATVVMLYLGRTLNVRLRDRILKDLAPGTRVVSHAFDMGDWKADEHDVVQEREVFSWVVPAEVAGKWRWTEGTGRDGTPVELELTQSYQHFAGTLQRPDGALPVSDGALSGERITFSVVSTVNGAPLVVRYDGRVAGNTIRGTVDAGRGPRPWVADRMRQNAALPPAVR
ncbi:MAG: methyltransferase domain-containing protein [Candidatus Eiseniibacteriota bacterium]